MSIDEASEVIGLSPGWRDGIHGVSQIDLGNKAETRVAWINLNGAIVAGVDRGIQNPTFVPASEFVSSYEFGPMLYDRTAGRFVDSSWWFDQMLVLLGSFLISMLPAIAFAKACRIATLEFLWLGTFFGLAVYVVLAFYFKTMWLGHDIGNFNFAVCVISLSTFASTTLLAARRLLTKRPRPISRPTDQVIQ